MKPCGERAEMASSPCTIAIGHLWCSAGCTGAINFLLGYEDTLTLSSGMFFQWAKILWEGQCWTHKGTLQHTVTVRMGSLRRKYQLPAALDQATLAEESSCFPLYATGHLECFLLHFRTTPAEGSITALQHCIRQPYNTNTTISRK